MRSIDARLAERTHGFDWLRLLLAVWVIAYHCVALTRSTEFIYQTWWFRLLSEIGVPGFFCISGFLVAASADRATPVQFIANRMLRVWPALAVVTLLTVFVAGPIVTTAPLADYFSDPKTWTQFTILVGVQQTQLTGFQGFKILDCNGSLWSIPWEVACYYGLLMLTLAGGLKRRWLTALAALAACGMALFGADPQRSVAHCIACFACGSAVYAYRAQLRSSVLAGVLACALALAIIAAGYGQWIPPLLAYGLIALGLAPAPKLKSDLSYGIYLSAFPAQQVLSLHDWGRHWWVNLALATLWAVAYAALSWRLVESPALRLKRRFARKPAATPAHAQAMATS